MIPELQVEWITRLRSGEYLQGQNRLRTRTVEAEPDRWCCLGVLCDMAEEAGKVAGQWADGLVHPSIYRYEGRAHLHMGAGTAVLPGAVVAWAGLSSSNPRLDQDIVHQVAQEAHLTLIYHAECYHTLSSLNDSGEWTFDMIADVIERGGVVSTSIPVDAPGGADEADGEADGVEGAGTTE